MQEPEGWGRPLILLYINSVQPQLTTYMHAARIPSSPLGSCLFYSQKQLAPTAAVAERPRESVSLGPSGAVATNLYQINKYTMRCARAKESSRGSVAQYSYFSLHQSLELFIAARIEDAKILESHSACRRNLCFCAPIGPRVENSFNRANEAQVVRDALF
jgi:hypothetical protein